MKSLLSLPLYKMLSDSLIILPTPVNISVMWNFGSMLGVSLMIQILSGFFLSMHYCPHIDMAFFSLIHIIQDVNWGWLIRLIHMNGASFYFIFMYIHIARGIYYHSFFKISVWFIGVVILLFSMAAAFMGYVLPWGQMSFWGATVITNLMSAIPYLGNDIVLWLWGGFSINNATLNRFYSFHFLLPFIILLLVIFHLYFLHSFGSNNPSGLLSLKYMISFHPYFTFKDILGFLMMFFFLIFICLQFPNLLGDPDNYMPANSLVTPLHIQPEWYFLFSYSILRSIPSKLGGVMSLFLSILILLILPFSTKSMMLGLTFYPVTQFFFWIFIISVIMLTWTGARPIEYPFFQLGQIMSFIYFTYFIFSLYIYSLWDLFIFN